MVKLKPEYPDEDLLYLPSIDDIKVTDHLETRYASDKIYTRIGQNIMVMVNPYKALDEEISSDEAIQSFTSKIKEGLEREPHIFELAASTYLDMCDSKQDQSILFLYVPI
jgi:myosin heavy subunit